MNKGTIGAVATVSAILVSWTLYRVLSPRSVEVEVGEVRRGLMRVTVEEDGRTRVKDRYIVSAPVLGQLSRITLHPGDAIEAGQVLARLISLEPPLLDARARAELEARMRAASAARRQAEASVEAAKAAHTFAAAELRRTDALAAVDQVSRQTRDRAELEEKSRAKVLESAVFAVRVADHELELAQAALARSRRGGGDDQILVTSPVRGVVLRVLHESEGAITAGSPLLELGDPAALEIVSDLLTADAVRVRPGASVAIERWGGEGALGGHVRTIEPAAFTKTSALGIDEQRVNVVIDLDEPRQRFLPLGDGYRVEVSIEVYRREDVLVVPASALFREGDAWMAYAVVGEHARRIVLDVKSTNGRETEFEGDLVPGARVVLYPSDRVSEGASLRALGSGKPG